MATPAWMGATTGYPAYAGQVNQFLGTHAISYVWQGVVQASANTGSGSVASDGLWIAQSFTTGSAQSATGVVEVASSVTGSPAPWTISIQASVSGAPSGTPLASVSLPKEFLTSSTSVPLIMLPVTGLSASTQYWIVAEAVGDAGDYFSWAKSAATSGAVTSANGTTWTTAAYGLAYAVRDNMPAPPLAGTYEDSGNRWTAYTYGAVSGVQALTKVQEFTQGQSANGYTVSSRALSYTGATLTGVS